MNITQKTFEKLYSGVGMLNKKLKDIDFFNSKNSNRKEPPANPTTSAEDSPEEEEKP